MNLTIWNLLLKDFKREKKLVYLIVEVWYPSKVAVEVGQKYLKVREKFPSDKKLAEDVISAFNSVTEGIHGITAWEIKEGKLAAFLKRTAEAMLMYGEIEGFKYSINTYLSATECMPMIGLKIPEMVV